MKLIMLTISQLDRTGFVTQTEFDDILKLNLLQLKDRNLIPILNNFRSVQNKVLIDYIKFRNWVQDELKKI